MSARKSEAAKQRKRKSLKMALEKCMQRRDAAATTTTTETLTASASPAAEAAQQEIAAAATTTKAAKAALKQLEPMETSEEHLESNTTTDTGSLDTTVELAADTTAESETSAKHTPNKSELVETAAAIVAPVAASTPTTATAAASPMEIPANEAVENVAATEQSHPPVQMDTAEAATVTQEADNNDVKKPLNSPDDNSTEPTTNTQ